MILPDHEIATAIAAGVLGVDPFEPTNIQPASLDIRLDAVFRVFDHQAEIIDPRSGASISHGVALNPGQHMVLLPGEFMLASSVETFRFPSDLAGQLGGKSSLGRLGLQIHATAGFIDPGFHGMVTLELSNVARLPIRLYPGMKIAQMVFLRMASPCLRPYGSDAALGSKYMGQEGPVESRSHRNFELVP